MLSDIKKHASSFYIFLNYYFLFIFLQPYFEGG